MQKQTKHRLVFLVKLACSVGIIAWIFRKILARENAEDLLARLGEIHWAWIALGVAIQLAGITCSVTRWNLLLVGQGIRAPIRHLVGTFMVGRFFGAFTPGGWTGLNGYRIYDIARHTGKTARATAAIGIEMILGWVAFGAVVIAGSAFGRRYIGSTGVLLVDAFFVALIAGAIVLLSRPRIFRAFAKRLPRALEPRVRTTVDAVCAYEGRGKLVTVAALLGMGTHGFHTLLYVATAHALGANLGVGDVLFVSAMQIFATLMPASVNGVGIREATAVTLYTRVGVPAGLAVLIPLVGFAVEMVVSAFGGLVFLARRVDYAPAIKVDDDQREGLAAAEIPAVAREDLPRIGRGTALGFGGGLLAGALVGLVEAVVVLLSGRGEPDLSVVPYGTVAYGVSFALAGALVGFLAAWSGRLLGRAAVRDSIAYARMIAALVGCAVLGLGAFRIRRDVFHEELVWKSPKGALVALGTLVVSVVVYAIVRRLVCAVADGRVGRVLVRPVGSLALFGALVLAAVGASALEPSAKATPHRAGPAVPAEASNILVVVVDTLRADHLAAYGYAAGRTPHLDAFARDAIRFDQAFANSSWTRPSFASILTGRYASSHRVMAKSDALPDGLVTLPEALGAAGYSTHGVVTNYNLAPFFNFHQGFDDYAYLEPEFVLGANDTAAKLLLVQFLRQRIETLRYSIGIVEPGSAYRDATFVNQAIFQALDRAGRETFFVFAGYMDPHDPYYAHPYDGSGYARAAHPSPDPSEADALELLYDGEITFWDDAFGALVAELKRRDLYDAMTLVVTSDHGEEFMEHGGFWHGTTLYDEQVRIPLYVKLPRAQRGGTVVAHWVESIDLMPTLLRQAGVSVPEGIQGGDLFQGTDVVFSEEDHEGNALEALRTRRGGSELKIITANIDNPRGLAPVELFRVDQDPRERVNLADEQPDVTAVVTARLDERRSHASTGAATSRHVDADADPAAAARLRALGYAGGDNP